jgi:NAD(P)-dependent dehydrogenase (short-subunit alcohol dehydrogenase family)
MTDPRRLAGKVVLVTGTSRNIGGVAAAGLAAAGARVACNDLRPDRADDAAGTIRAAGGEAIAVPGDVADEAQMAATVDRILQTWGTIDGLVCNAVRFDQRGVLTMPVDAYRKQLDVILTGAFVATQLVARTMIEGGVKGWIVTVLSTAAWQGQAGNIGYCTAKSGLINFTRSAAMELAPYGIRVNSLTPTATMPDDPQLASAFSAAADQMAARGLMDFSGQNPWERLPTPSDYVAPLVFLASDDAAMMTGTNLTVDGGALAKYWPQPPARHAARKDEP